MKYYHRNYFFLLTASAVRKTRKRKVFNGQARQLICSVPVSYTHLDVYKRQLEFYHKITFVY